MVLQIRHQTLRVMLFIAASLLSSCAFFGPKPDAEVSLVDLSFTGVTLFETTANLAVRVENRNDEPITVEGGVHRISVDGTELGSGSSPDKLSLAPFTSGVQNVQIHLSNLSMLTRIRSLVERQRFDYEIESRLPIRMNGMRQTVEIDRSGKVEPQDLGAAR